MGIAVLSITPALAGLLRPRKLPKIVQVWLFTGLASILFLVLLTYLPVISKQGPVEISIPWVPDLGLSLSLYLDGLSVFFGLIVTGIGAAIIIYAGYYFEDRAELGRFYIRLLAFMTAMLIVVFSGNLLTLFIGWELTSIISFLLIGFNRDSEEARSGALQALIITGMGGLALLVGVSLLGTTAGSMELSEVIANTTLRESPWYTAFTVLILVGCFTKSAQWPFHFWLPGAMSAPTPASAYLHSATMVKAGIYLLLRLYPALGDTLLWQNGLLTIGLVTMLLGGLLALRQRDLKAALAYSTISQLGVLVALISLPHGEGLKAALVGILAHSLYKATLFMVVGAVDHASGTRLLDKLGGLGRLMPGWGVVALLAGLSMAGLPPLLGFVAKESLLEATHNNPVALIIILITAACTVGMALILLWEVFGGKTVQLDHIHALPDGLLVGPAALAAGSILGGLGLQVLVVPLLNLTLSEEVHLVLFSGLNTSFLLSLLAIGGGVAIFATREIWRGWSMPLTLPTGSQIYQGIVHRVEQLGDLLLLTQGGKLRYYLVVILGSVILLQGTAGLAHVTGYPLVWEFSGSIDILRVLLLLLALGAMFASIIFKKHLLAALALGVAGYSVGGLFLLEPAPDVALVQFMVETIGTVLLIVMLARIKPEERQQAIDSLWSQSHAGLLRDVIISTLIGVGVGLFALAAVTNRPKPESIATWHLENTLAEVGFPDVVGAIVTDFRGMDTIIEITVFSVAALGVLTLLSKPKANPRWPVWIVNLTKKFPLSLLRREGQSSITITSTLTMLQVDVSDESDLEPDLFTSTFSTPLTRVVAQFVLPFAFLVALTHLLYGGDGPGDGFTAGIISGLGITLYYIVFGYHEARRRLHWLHERRLIGAGLVLVIVNGVLPMLSGQSFLAHLNFDQITLPANLHLSSTLIYETGIFITILGSVSTIMEAIAFPKEVEPL